MMSLIRLSEKIATSMGPNSYYKEIIGPDGRATRTHDGATMLRELDAVRPVEHEIKQIAEAIENDPGDRTKSVIILIGQLLKETIYLKNKHELTDRDIARGYSWAADKAMAELENMSITDNGDSRYKSVIETALSTKMDKKEREHLSNIILKGFKSVKNSNNVPDPSSIHVLSLSGAGLEKSELIESGIVVERTNRYKEMSRDIYDAKIAMFEGGIPASKDARFRGANINLNNKYDDGDFQKMIKEIDTIDTKYIADILWKLKDADVIVSKQNIDDAMQRIFIDKEIRKSVLRNFIKDDAVLETVANKTPIIIEGSGPQEFERISRATGAKIKSEIISTNSKISENELGYAGHVTCKPVEGRSDEERLIFIERCKYPESVTLILRGPTDEITNEVARNYDDASKVLKIAMMKDCKFVPSACAVEAELAFRLYEYADTVKTEERHAIRSFADALMYIPRVIAMNSTGSRDSGKRSYMVLLTEHEKGNKNAGLDVSDDTIKTMDALAAGLVEPKRLAERYISLASRYVKEKIMTDGVFVKKG